MPVYEFLCADCGRKSSFLTRSVNSPLEPVCQACGSSRMQRAVSSFAIGNTAQQGHTEETPYDNGTMIPDTIRETIDAAREGRPPVGLDP